MHRLYLGALFALFTALGVLGLSQPSGAGEATIETVHRVNSGGPALAAQPQWLRDGSRESSSYLLSGNAKTSFTRKSIDMSHPSVLQGTSGAVFKDQRNRSRRRPLRYGFPVEPGKYEVSLLFAEIRTRAHEAGRRVMRVTIEGTRVLDRYEVFRHVGAHTAVVKTFATTSNRVLKVKLRGLKGRPMINGIEIVRIGDPSKPNPEPQPQPEPAPQPQPVGECEGIEVTGGSEALVEAMTSHEGPTTFCVAPGDYVAGLEGFPVEDGDVVHGAGVGETFLSSEDAQRVIDGRGADGVTIIGVDISGGRDDGGKNACDELHALCGRSIEPGDNWTIRNARVHHADTSGISSPGHSLLIDNVEIDHNGLQWNGPDNNGISAGIKGGDAGAFTITNSFVHDNNQGIWCDVDCDNLNGGFVVENNRVLDNCSFGIHYENTYKDPSTPASAIITGNVVKGNNWCELPNKAEIGIVSAENATVRDNVFGATPANPEPGYGFSAFDRGLGASTGSARANVFELDRIHQCQAPFVCD